MMRQKAVGLLACFLAVAVCVAAAYPQAAGSVITPASLDARIQKRLEELHANGEFPGVVVGYVLPDGRSGAAAAGFSDKEAKIPMRPGDRMFSGSVGKTYVAAVAFQLMQEGKFGLDDLVAKWLGKEPWFARVPNAGQLTVRMLLGHTGGVPEYYDKPSFNAQIKANLYKVWKPEELIAHILDLPPANVAGAAYSYADTNYLLLGMIIEKATGKTYYAELKRRILKPCKLKNTEPSVKPRLRGLIPGYSTLGRQLFGFGDEKTVKDGLYAFNPQMEWTGGGLISNAEDLARWVRIYVGGDVVPASLRREMTKVTFPMGPNPNAMRYGLGIIISQTPFGPALGHSGFMPGYLTEMYYLPEKKLALALQFNTDNGRSVKMNTRAFLWEIARTILETNVSGGSARTPLSRNFQVQGRVSRTQTRGMVFLIKKRSITLEDMGQWRASIR